MSTVRPPPAPADTIPDAPAFLGSGQGEVVAAARALGPRVLCCGQAMVRAKLPMGSSSLEVGFCAVCGRQGGSEGVSGEGAR